MPNRRQMSHNLRPTALEPRGQLSKFGPIHQTWNSRGTETVRRCWRERAPKTTLTKFPEMFYYISFLRPPPYKSPPGLPVSITPQIANDLRTELFTGEQDIYYSWLPVANGGGVPQHPVVIPRPVKLTTWRESNAYREVSVPPPQGVREGQQYRLVLTTHSQGYPYIINLASPTTGDRPFPVLSMPITFTDRKDVAALTKQERVERVYRICGGAGEQAFLSIKEQTTFDLDKVRRLICKVGPRSRASESLG